MRCRFMLCANPNLQAPRPLTTARYYGLSESPEARGGRLLPTHSHQHHETVSCRPRTRLHILPKPDSAEPSMDRGEARRPPLPRFSQARLARSRVVPNPPVVCAYLKHASVDSCNPAVPRRSTSQAHTSQPPAVAIDEPESFNWVMCNTHASDIIFAHQQIKPLCSTSRGPWALLFLGPESKLLFFPPAAVSLSLLLCIIGHCVLYTRARKVKPLGRANMDTTEDFSPYRPDGKLVSCRAPKSMRGTDGTHKINSGRVWLRLCRHRYFAARW